MSFQKTILSEKEWTQEQLTVLADQFFCGKHSSLRREKMFTILGMMETDSLIKCVYTENGQVTHVRVLRVPCKEIDWHGTIRSVMEPVDNLSVENVPLSISECCGY